MNLITESINALPLGLQYYIGDLHFETHLGPIFLTILQNGDLSGATDGSVHTIANAES